MKDENRRSEAGPLGRAISRRAALKLGVAGSVAAVEMAHRQSLLKAFAAQGAAGGRLVIGKVIDLQGYDPQLDASQVSW